jgi:hypothetical protein
LRRSIFALQVVSTSLKNNTIDFFMNHSTFVKPTSIHWVGPFIAALVVVNVLFFIDEGYYDFRWMLQVGNWIVFALYMAILFPVQWLISRFLFRKQTGATKILLDAITGIILSLGVILLL